MLAKARLAVNAAATNVNDVIWGKIGTTVDKKIQAPTPKTKSFSVG